MNNVKKEEKHIFFNAFLVVLAVVLMDCLSFGDEKFLSLSPQDCLAPSLEINNNHFQSLISKLVAKQNTFSFSNPNDEQLIYRQDLESDDPEVRLMAAIALRASGDNNSIISRIFKESAVNKNLTLAERIKAAEYLSEKEKSELGLELRRDRNHFEFIDQWARGDMKQLTPRRVSFKDIGRIIGRVEGIDPIMKESFVQRIRRLNWSGTELDKVMRGIDYLNGNWKKELIEMLQDGEEYDFHPDLVAKLLESDVPKTIFFSAKYYLYAAIITQEVLTELSREPVVIMGGDREWLFLTVFQIIVEDKNYFPDGNEAELKKTVKIKWKESTAASRIVDIFKNLEKLELYRNDYVSDVEMAAVLGVANQFIYRAYVDGEGPEYSLGPCYARRGISIGIENDRGKDIESIHINLGVSAASKSIWAAYLSTYPYITSSTFSSIRFDYFYSQLITKEFQIGGNDRRTSYIGIWVDHIEDLNEVLRTFVPLSIALRSYAEKDNPKLAIIWRNFRLKMEEIVREQNDSRLNEEYFNQARMVRFVELVSAKERNNEFFKKLKNLIENTITEINNEILNNHEKEYNRQTNGVHNILPESTLNDVTGIIDKYNPDNFNSKIIEQAI